LIINKQIYDMSAQEALKVPKLTLDDTFPFSCKACGRCCQNRDDITLFALDVYRLAGYFGRTPAEIIERYCDRFVGENSRLPLVVLRMVPPKQACPFLRNKRCSVHSAKPGSCRMYPLARVYELEGPAKFHQIQASCNHEPNTLTVREWIAEFADEENQRAGRLWNDILFPLTAAIHPNRFSCSREQRSEMQDVIFHHLYLQYDPAKEFLPQLTENAENLRQILLERFGLKVQTMAEYVVTTKEELAEQGIIL